MSDFEAMFLKTLYSFIVLLFFLNIVRSIHTMALSTHEWFTHAAQLVVSNL